MPSNSGPNNTTRSVVTIYFWLLPLVSSLFYLAGGGGGGGGGVGRGKGCPRIKNIFFLNYLVIGNL